jgi:hypothetical protein
MLFFYNFGTHSFDCYFFSSFVKLIFF